MPQTQSSLNETHLHDVIRDALAAADALALYDSVWNAPAVARGLEDLRTALAHVDRAVGAKKLRGPEVAALTAATEGFAGLAERVASDVRPRVRILLGRARRIDARVRALPTVTDIPRAVVTSGGHAVQSALGFGAAAGCAAAGLLAHSGEAKFAGVALGAAGTALAVCDAPGVVGDGRMARGALRVGGGALGVAAVAAPFVLGYHRRDPVTAVVHVVAGLGALINAVFRR